MSYCKYLETGNIPRYAEVELREGILHTVAPGGRRRSSETGGGVKADEGRRGYIPTGTPAGVGPLRPGDSIQIEGEGLGVLANGVASEQSAPQSSAP